MKVAAGRWGKWVPDHVYAKAVKTSSYEKRKLAEIAEKRLCNTGIDYEKLPSGLGSVISGSEIKGRSMKKFAQHALRPFKNRAN